MNTTEFLHESPFTVFCQDNGLIQVRHIKSIDAVKKHYGKYKKWCKKHNHTKPETFNAFITHLHDSLGIVPSSILVEYRKNLPIGRYCQKVGLIQIKQLRNADNVKKHYKKYKKWCEENHNDEPKDFKAFIFYLNRLLDIVPENLFLEFYKDGSPPELRA